MSTFIIRKNLKLKGLFQILIIVIIVIVSCSGPSGAFADPVLLPQAKPGEKSWIRFEFAKPVTIQSLTIAFRVAFRTQERQAGLPAGQPSGGRNMPGPSRPSGTNISELVISPVARVNRFEEKATGTVYGSDPE